MGLNFTLFFAAVFYVFTINEYRTASFNISYGIYGLCFYMTTGFHGFHIFVDTIALIIAMLRLSCNHFTNTHHVGLELAIWYWHFVDIV